MSDKKLYDEVDDVINKIVKKNSTELNTALIKPLSDEYKFSTNGFYIFCGKMGSGKTLEIIKHILITDRMNNGDGYYNLIVFCSTSGGLDKTVQAFLPKIKTPIAFVPDSSLLQFLNAHIKMKKKYYSLYKYINSEGKKIDDEFKRLIDKHKLDNDEKKLLYVAQKMMKYNTTRYPLNLLLILDDFAGHPLINRPDNELCRILTKTRHYNITCILAVQSTKFVIKNLKRICTDLVLWRGVSWDDFYNLMRELPHNFDVKQVWEEYRKLSDPHSKLVMNLYAGCYEIQK